MVASCQGTRNSPVARGYGAETWSYAVVGALAVGAALRVDSAARAFPLEASHSTDLRVDRVVARVAYQLPSERSPGGAKPLIKHGVTPVTEPHRASLCGGT